MADRPLSTADSLAVASSMPLPGSDGASLREPQPHFLDADSRKPSSLDQPTGESAMGDSTAAFGTKEVASSDGADSATVEAGQEPKPKKRTALLALIALGVLIVVVLAVILPVYFTVIKKKDGDSGASSSGSSATDGTHHSAGPTPTSTPTRAKSGGDGSTVTKADGTTFVYANSFGGIWVDDIDNPYNNSARPNSWTPPLNERFNYATNRIYGVNLGGLFVLEPFISPELFQRYPGTVDEWTLSEAMAADASRGGLRAQMEEHYNTFITEEDIAQIAGAGLNYIRLPIPYWAIEVWPGEPFLEKVSWPYIIRTLQWCRKYGIRVNLDLHTVPGSANAYNHGGRAGRHNFLNGVMGWANAQRTMNYIRIITEFISQPEWKDVVTMFSILNEPIVTTIGQDTLRSFYVEAHRLIREIGGFGEGNGPYVVAHDSFQGLQSLAGFMTDADRFGGDVHPYFAFGGSATAPSIDSGVGADAGGGWPLRACTRFAGMMNESRVALGVSVAGEFSNAFIDCGLYLRGVNGAPDYTGDCGPWDDSSNWGPGIKAGILAFVSAQMDSLMDWFFWTWKIGPSQRGIVEAPLWSYQLGLVNGWMPTDPRTVIGTCAALGGPTGTWDGTFSPAMTGGPGAGLPSDGAQYPWPPANIAGVGAAPAALPSYTPTGTIVVLPTPTFTDSKGNAVPGGDGWFDNDDVALAPTPIAGCTYPDPWNSEDAAIPALC